MTRNMRTRLAIGLALIGIASIAVGWYMASKPDSLSGQWQPINSQLTDALESLSATDPAKPEIEPASVPATVLPTPEPTIDTVQPSPAPSPEQSEPSDAVSTLETRLNLNEATTTQLESLPGIGPSKAKAIIAFRDLRGGYRSVDELLDVKGIGPKMLEKLLPEVYVP
ncbi:ComEA family DNA-binding protein [Cohnella panacarvi]|uniref:ComEA family DNA-binding protein n=1 Tax=Cohnella panacarvi TaxID=400776 RepID=UPI000479D937|nr:ComEA family DNA-binding protein [Cohnella panacarvi]